MSSVRGRELRSGRELRDESVRVRINSTEKDLSLADAQAMGMTLSEWVRWLILSRLGRHPEAAVSYSSSSYPGSEASRQGQS